MNLRQLLIVLRLRWWLVLTVTLLALGAGGAYVTWAPRIYQAQTQMILDLKTDPLLSALAPALAAPAYVATQVEIIQSDRLASRVVRTMGLAQSPAAVAQWREQTSAKMPLETYFGELLQRGLEVVPGKGNQIVTIGFRGSDPQFAAAAANTYAKAYIDLSVELRSSPARENASFFDEKLKKLRTDLETAQAKLAEFQQQKGVVITADRYDQESARLANLEAALASALAERAAATSMVRNSGSDSSLDVAQSSAVQSLRAQLASAETKLAEVSATLGARHPTRVQLETQIAELKDQVAREARRVSSTTASADRVGSTKVNELRAMVEAQKRTVLQMRALRDEGSFLLRDVEVAQKAFDAVTGRVGQLSLEAQADLAGARILSPAVAPLEPVSPNWKKTLVAAIVVGLALGGAAALGWELLDRRVRSVDDLAALDGVPLLSVLSSKPVTVRRLPVVQGPPQLTMSRGPH